MQDMFILGYVTLRKFSWNLPYNKIARQVARKLPSETAPDLFYEIVGVRNSSKHAILEHVCING